MQCGRMALPSTVILNNKSTNHFIVHVTKTVHIIKSYKLKYINSYKCIC